MTTHIDCPTCYTGVISPHEQAQKHDRCGDCRLKIELAQKQRKTINDFDRANKKVR